MSQRIKEWKSCMNLDKSITDLLKNQSDRGFCKFTFKNNLEDQYTIDYIKITHVFEGRDAFVYEHTNIPYDSELVIYDYAIGVKPNSDGTGKLNVNINTNVGKDNTKVKDNVYDRLYIHFIINRNGKQELFHHCYEQFIDKNLMDLITVDNKISEKKLALTNINLYFDPEFDKYQDNNKNEMYKLVLQVIAPGSQGELINVKPAKLKG